LAVVGVAVGVREVGVGVGMGLVDVGGASVPTRDLHPARKLQQPLVWNAKMSHFMFSRRYLHLLIGRSTTFGNTSRRHTAEHLQLVCHAAKQTIAFE
jgi:hypothetical protein